MDLLALLMQFAEFLKPYLIGFAEKQPVVLSILGVIGFMRLIMKPLFDFAKAVVAATSSKKDDEFLAKVEASSIYKVLAYIIDWLGSVKIGPQSPEQQAAKLMEKYK